MHRVPIAQFPELCVDQASGSWLYQVSQYGGPGGGMRENFASWVSLGRPWGVSGEPWGGSGGAMGMLRRFRIFNFEKLK